VIEEGLSRYVLGTVSIAIVNVAPVTVFTPVPQHAPATAGEAPLLCNGLLDLARELGEILFGEDLLWSAADDTYLRVDDLVPG
jgi:hypothetical protein